MGQLEVGGHNLLNVEENGLPGEEVTGRLERRQLNGRHHFGIFHCGSALRLLVGTLSRVLRINIAMELFKESSECVGGDAEALLGELTAFKLVRLAMLETLLQSFKQGVGPDYIFVIPGEEPLGVINELLVACL